MNEEGLNITLPPVVSSVTLNT